MGEEYLTIAELADRLRLKPKTIKNKMAAGAFRPGVHYFRPPGMQARFKWSAVVAWLEQSQQPGSASGDDGRRATSARRIGPILGGSRR